MKEIGKIIDLPLETTSTGEFVSIDDKKQQIPFRVKRAYWIYGVPQGENRGGHAHKQLRQVIIAAKDEDKAETVYEISDLIYHVMVLMIEMGITLDDIKSELASRHVIDHKVKQEKMTK